MYMYIYIHTCIHRCVVGKLSSFWRDLFWVLVFWHFAGHRFWGVQGWGCGASGFAVVGSSRFRLGFCVFDLEFWGLGFFQCL